VGCLAPSGRSHCHPIPVCCPRARAGAGHGQPLGCSTLFFQQEGVCTEQQHPCQEKKAYPHLAVGPGPSSRPLVLPQPSVIPLFMWWSTWLHAVLSQHGLRQELLCPCLGAGAAVSMLRGRSCCVCVGAREGTGGPSTLLCTAQECARTGAP